MPKDRAILHAYDRHDEVLRRRTTSLHRYWDGAWALLDDPSARKAAGVRRLSAVLYGTRGEVVQVWDNRYDARGKLVRGEAWHFDARGRVTARTG